MNLFVNVSCHPQPVSTAFSNLLLHSERKLKFIYEKLFKMKNSSKRKIHQNKKFIKMKICTCNLSLTDVCFSDASFKSPTFFRADLRLASVSDRAFSLRFSCERSFPTSTTLPENNTTKCISFCQLF